MIIDEAEARAIAGRWGTAADSPALIAFAETGLIADRKRLKEAIGGLRLFLKDTSEVDRLEAFVDNPCPSERAARREGWSVEGDRIFHVHDYDRRVSYKTWDECCRGEDIEAES
jgi:hypothetical protein